MVNPRVMYSTTPAPKGTNYATVNRNIVHMVDFDIAVTSDSSSDAGGKLALKVAGIGGIEGGWRSVNHSQSSQISNSYYTSIAQPNFLKGIVNLGYIR